MGSLVATGDTMAFGNVTLGANTTINSAGGAINLGTVNADAVLNNRKLTLLAGAGTATLSDNIGSGQALADLDITAASIVFNAPSAQVVNVTAQGGNVATLTGPVTVAQNLTVTTAGTTDNNLTFTGTINADNDDATHNRTLTLDAGAGTLTLGGDIGATKALAGLDITAGSKSRWPTA
jgi:hypothetical protein